MKNVTIRRDLDRLTAMGNNIQKENREHNTAYYALIGKGFSFNEIRFIVDSITINKFMTTSQKQTLIKKFEGMCSDTELRQLISRIVLNEDVRLHLIFWRIWTRYIGSSVNGGG